MKESKVEKHFKKEWKAIGGLSRKWVSPGVIGVADQLAFHQYPIFYLVELKAPGKVPRESQLREAARVEELGYTYVVLDTIPKVDRFIRKVKRRVAKLQKAC